MLNDEAVRGERTAGAIGRSAEGQIIEEQNAVLYFCRAAFLEVGL